MPTQYDLLPRSSSSSDEYEFKDKPLPPLPFRYIPLRYANLLTFPLTLLKKTRRHCRPLYFLLVFLAFFLWQIIFNGSYTNPPPFTPHPTETVFIAANIIDGELITGGWGASLLSLVDAIGKDRVFVSIYGGPTPALKHLESLLECEHSIVSEAEFPIALNLIPHTKLPTGEERIKRIAYLAEVRNKALEPLSTLNRKFDKMLFINDVFFSAQDGLRLLWGTNVNGHGRAQYKAACGADFITSWKYYDTYGTRDFDGYSMGVPIFPWFAGKGNGVSRRDVLAGKDSVRVKSCWGGIVAFDGRYFLPKSMDDGKGGEMGEGRELRFRSEMEPFWDASECCLIHADIMALPPFAEYSEDVAAEKPVDWEDGIFMNPYVRVSYDASTYSRIWIVKKFERLFALPQAIISYFAGMPRFNYRRTEREGDAVQDRIWVPSKGVGERATLGKGKGKEYWAGKGHYENFTRIATKGGYCGVRQLLVLKESDGEGNWDNLLDQVPPLDV